MWLLTFYRFYLSLLFGFGIYFFLGKNIRLGILGTIVFRTMWYSIEHFIRRHGIQKDFNTHIAAFKQEHGPYGIRLANKAEEEWRIKESLAEVFTPDIKKLKKAVEQLEMMDTLFQAGMRPEGDEYLLHDLKLKYGKMRLEKEK
jgi:hypothetical protein